MALQKPEQLELLSKKKKSKYGNRRMALGGYTFDSIAEAARYVQLKLEEEQGIIKALEVKPVYKFECDTKYIPDFRYYRKVKKFLSKTSLDLIVEDVKSKPTMTPSFKIKSKLLKTEYGIIVSVVHMDSQTARTLVYAYLGQHKNKK